MILSNSPGMHISVSEGNGTVVDFSITGASEIGDGVEIDLRVLTSDGSAMAGERLVMKVLCACKEY